MTFKDALFTTDAKINFLGGLETITPHLPYSLKVIRNELDNCSEDEDANWNLIATQSKAFMGFCAQKGITKIPTDECAELLKAIYKKLLDLPEQEQSKYFKPEYTSKYKVRLKIAGYVTIEVDALNTKDAKELAYSHLADIDKNAVTIDYKDAHPIDVEDSNGSITSI